MEYDRVTIDGRPYPTRNNPDFVTVSTTRELYDLTDTDYCTAIAIHEAGHAVAHLAGGRAHLVSIRLSDDLTTGHPGAVDAISYDLHGRARVIADCAGERAVDMWLHRTGLWTPTRAVAAEIGGCSDRAGALEVPGMTHALLRDMHDPTDDLLAAHWGQVEAVAEAVLHAGYLTGDEAAAITGLPNQPWPADSLLRIANSQES